MKTTKKRTTVRWELSGQCTVELDPAECADMTDEEIHTWAKDGVHIEVHEQSAYSVRPMGTEDAIRGMREGLK